MWQCTTVGMSSFCNGIRHLVKAVLVEMFGFAQQEERSSSSFRHDFEYEPQRKKARSPSPEEWTDDQRLTLINEEMNIPQLWGFEIPRTNTGTWTLTGQEL
ncbi:hypothetical protein Q1695_002689 [Nippostrongylus brasiliensis]|nr:hypothetical protein Q1695_002689 [Nippostrongylus brasiliensis]